MSYRLKNSYIREYSTEIAKEICDGFYKNHSVIDGKQLVNLTEIRQLNLFLVKKMYLRWQEEGAALHSAFFNYAAPEVRQSFNRLMNVLSKNISIGRADFEPFLATTIKETLYFLLDPPSYFSVLFDGFSGKIYTRSQIFPLKKYYRYHFPLIEKYFDALDEEANKIKSKKALKVLHKCIEKYPALLSNTSETINEFNTYKTFLLEEAYLQQSEEELEQEQTELLESNFVIGEDAESDEERLENQKAEQTTFVYEDFSNEEERLGNTEKTETKVEETPKQEIKEDISEPVEENIEIKETQNKQEEAVEEEHQEESITESVLDNSQEENALKQDSEQVSNQNEDTDANIKQVVETEGEDEGFNDFILSDEIEEEAKGITKATIPLEHEDEEILDKEVSNNEDTEPKTLLEKLQQGKQKPEGSTQKTPLFSHEEEEEEDDDRGYATVNEKLRGQETVTRKKLKGNIPLNMKLRYKKELFGDDQQEFDNAIELIDECNDYHQAINLLKEKFVSKYSWDFTGDSTREFLSMIDTHFH